MDREENKFHSYGSNITGAIFMSNRATKLECLQRKLFGLPSSKAQLMQQIKAGPGMLLFLFEHEERKLYGVFEATCDGAMNIIPNAFLSSGCSFPAQVLFNRIWMCKPLSEDEFSDAIKDNYYAPNKFKFGLSYDQVFKLIQLFSSKRINVKQYQRSCTPNEIIREFKECRGSKARVTGRGGSIKFNSSMHDNGDSQMHHSFSGSNTNNSVSFDKHSRKQPSSLNYKSQLYQMVPNATEPCPPNYLHSKFDPPHLTGSTSPNDPSIGKISKLPAYGHHARGMDYSSLQNPIARIDIRPDQFDTQSSNLGSCPLHLCPPNSMGLSVPIFNTSIVSLPAVCSKSYPNFQDYKHEFHTQCYDSSNPLISFYQGMPEAKNTDLFPSAHWSSSLDYPDASRHEFSSEGQHSAHIPLPNTDCVDKNVRSSYLSSPSKVMLGNYISESMEADDTQGRRPYPTTDSEEYYKKVYFRFHSGAEQSKTSVFSHLSKASEGCRMPKSQESIQRNGAWKSIARRALDQVERILFQNRQQLTEMKKESKQSNMCDDNRKLEYTAVMKPSMVSSTGNLQSSNDLIDENGVAENANPKENTEQMFLKFNCTSEIVTLSDENEMNVCADNILDEDPPLRYKKRKLLIHSVGEDERQNVRDSTQEIIGVKIVVDNSETEMQNGEMSSSKFFHIDKKNSLAFESSLCDVASDKSDQGSRNRRLDGEKNSSASEASIHNLGSDKTYKSCEGLRTSQLVAENKNSSTSEPQASLRDFASDNGEIGAGSLISSRKVSNRNLRWFLEKSVDT